MALSNRAETGKRESEREPGTRETKKKAKHRNMIRILVIRRVKLLGSYQMVLGLMTCLVKRGFCGVRANVSKAPGTEFPTDKQRPRPQKEAYDMDTGVYICIGILDEKREKGNR